MPNDAKFGFIKPALDAHTMGINSVSQLLRDCGYVVEPVDEVVCKAVERLEREHSFFLIRKWLARKRITHLGFSYRLDPDNGYRIFQQLLQLLDCHGMLFRSGGCLRELFFAGLPDACEKVERNLRGQVEVFWGDEDSKEVLDKLGVPVSLFAGELLGVSSYDEFRWDLGKEIISKEGYRDIFPPERASYTGFGKRDDNLWLRLRHAHDRNILPLIRTHMGPYSSNRLEALRLFSEWVRTLAGSGFVDVLSIGSSQLSQSRFGMEWGDRPNGGGVPVNSEADLIAVWEAARPMLVRSYSATDNILNMAQVLDRTISNAWHALSIWWFNRLDGRGPLSVKDGIAQHYDTLCYLAENDRVFEPNVPHHFAFRGGDDVTYVLSGVLAAKLAKKVGIKKLVLQVMLNTPKSTWGVQDLAKARSLTGMVRELCDREFSVVLQPRIGLDYFSHRMDRAKIQLVAATALMDDIEPSTEASPPLIHVVNFSEAAFLADPLVIVESAKITLDALNRYRALKRREGLDMYRIEDEVAFRTRELTNEVRALLECIEADIEEPYTPAGLYRIFASGFLPVPYLWNFREEFSDAVRWKSKMINGGACLVDDTGAKVPLKERIEFASESAKKLL